MKRFRSQLVLACGLVLGAANIASGVGVKPMLLRPPNDDCANAMVVGNVANLLFNTTNATFDGPGHYIRSPNIWYCYTATCNGCATVSLQGSNFDTKIAAYDGCDCYPISDDLIKSNDDFYGQQSQITFPVRAGSQYLIEVGGFNPAAMGQGTISISCDAQSSQPTNNDCINARHIGNVTEQPFDTTCATFDGPGFFFTSPNVWYRYTAGGTGDVTVSLLGSEYDTALVVYDGGDCYPESGDLIERNDDFGGFLQSQITFRATAGKSYLFEVLGYNSDEVGEGVITVSSEGQPPSTNNDNCQNAKQIGEVTNMAFDTTSASQDGPSLCMSSSNLWYCYTATCTGQVTVSLAGSSYDTMLAVYDGCGCYPKSDDMIECNDDSGNTRQSEIVFDAVAGSQYLIEVGGYGLEAGEGMLSVSCEGVQPPPSSKDDCQNAKPVGDVKDLAFDTTGATFDGQGLCMTSPNVWYCYTATCTGDVTVSLAGSSYDTMLAVYDGCGCYPTFAANMIECNDDAGNSYQSEITFAATAGNQYLIEIGGYASETGEGLLSISCEGVQPPPSSKDDCENAKSVGDVKDLAFNTTDATFDGSGLCMTSPNIWYCYTATCTGDVTVSLADSSYDTMLAVYDGCECYPASEDLIECNDDAGNSYQSEVTFAAIAGKQYLIEIGGYATETGGGLLTISCEGVVVQNKPDLGDAPDSTNNFGNSMTAYPKGVFTGPRAHYPTVYNDGSGTGPYGPVHINAQTVAFLGKKITRETEADTGTDEDGVNNIRSQSNWPDDDEGDDGVVFPLNMPSCRFTTIDYTVNVVAPNTDLWVNIWLDWNRDGDWDDTLECPSGPAPEWAVQNQFLLNLPAGINEITTPGFLAWHPEGGTEEIWMRITLSGRPWRPGSNPEVRGNAGSGPEGKYEIGETEDYYFAPDVGITICEDYDGDGVIDLNDLAAFVADWLENCP
ncbi:GEVED domain-containing protein [Planctomycetota bacterium]